MIIAQQQYRLGSHFSNFSNITANKRVIQPEAVCIHR
jgi:hypothetical protein